MANPRDDLLELLAEHVDFLEVSAGLFDAGRLHEAKRLATSLRVLLHDTDSSHSLLGQLGVKETLQFVDSALHLNPRNLAYTAGLTIDRMSDSGGQRIAPGLDGLGPPRVHSPASFEDWWDRTVIRDGEGNDFSRRELVLALVNKDGGAHVDPRVGGKYKTLSREGSLAWEFQRGGEAPIKDLSSPVPASVRQVTAEVLATIRTAGLLP